MKVVKKMDNEVFVLKRKKFMCIVDFFSKTM